MIKQLVAAGCIVSMTVGCATTVSPNDNTYVVAVGMEKSDRFGECPGAEKDCTGMVNIFSKYTSHIKTFISDKANKDDVVAAMKDAASNAELFIFYYSGHGGQYSGYNSNETDGHDEFLCFNDTYMFDDEIWSIISQCKGRVFLIFDCCHSETMFKVKNPFAFKMPLAATHNAEGTLNMLCWSGCPDDTYSYGTSAGGEMTNTLKSYFNVDMTYDQLWEKIENDSNLKNYEAVQRTTMGDLTKFGSNKIFQ